MSRENRYNLCEDCSMCSMAVLPQYIDEECDVMTECCMCDKTQMRFYTGCDCGDIMDQDQYCKAGVRKTGRAYRRRMKHIKNKRLMKIVNMGNGYNISAGYVDWALVDGEYVPVGKYIKYPKNSNKQKYFKRYSNHIARKKEVPVKGNGYRKHFDYWWTLY